MSSDPPSFDQRELPFPLFTNDELGEAHARSSDPDTSKAAARSVAGIRQSQQLILNILKSHGPLSDQEILHLIQKRGYSISPSGARTRRCELQAKGLVKFSGEYTLTASKRRTRRWRAV